MTTAATCEVCNRAKVMREHADGDLEYVCPRADDALHRAVVRVKALYGLAYHGDAMQGLVLGILREEARR